MRVLCSRDCGACPLQPVLCSPDVYSKTKPFSVGKNSGYIREAFHFPVEPGKTVVQAGSNASQTTCNAGVGSRDPILFGIGLHTFQDSWSHAGFGPRAGHLSTGHDPDLPSKNTLSLNNALDMAEATFLELQQWSLASHKSKSPCDFGKIKSKLRAVLMTKGGEPERVRAWQGQILEDFGKVVRFQGSNDSHRWCGAFAKASNQVK